MLFRQFVLPCLFAFEAFAVVPDSKTYIITLKPGANIQSHVNERREGFEVKHVYSAVINGYAAALSPSVLEALRLSDDVQAIEMGHQGNYCLYVYLSSYQSRTMIVPTSSTFTQLGNARRLFEKKANGGAGVDIYFFDTGINLTKQCFGSRVRWGATFGGYQDIDGSGHGTALAASALCAEAGGTATSASGVAVKILSDSGSGTTSSLISGINWAVQQYQSTNRPSIGALALGGPASVSLDNAVAAAVNAGLHMVVTAGKFVWASSYSNTDVSTVSPARVAGAVTVGSIPRSKVRPTNR
ncbi:hypothetical protein RhiTH_001552 [Rhizoctonia solani]